MCHMVLDSLSVSFILGAPCPRGENCSRTSTGVHVIDLREKKPQYCDQERVDTLKQIRMWKQKDVPAQEVLLQYFILTEIFLDFKYRYSLGIVVVSGGSGMKKTLTFCNISVITEDIFLKLRICLHYPKSNSNYQGRQFKIHFFFFFFFFFAFFFFFFFLNYAPFSRAPAVDRQWHQMRKFRTDISKTEALANLLAPSNIYKSLIHKRSKLKHKKYVSNRMDARATVYHS